MKGSGAHSRKLPPLPPRDFLTETRINILAYAVRSGKGKRESRHERMVFMQSILEELYLGNFRPDSKIHAPDSDFVRHARVKSDNLDNVKGKSFMQDLYFGNLVPWKR